MAGPDTTVTVEGRRLRLSNLDKVLYPATGTTKGEVLHYLAQVAPAMLPHVTRRPATRKRWPDGVDGQSFFQKNAAPGTPSWVVLHEIRHKTSVNEYVLVDDVATLVWLGQTATLEIHTPQWRVGRTGSALPPDRLVLDLDPGPGVGLAECARVARWARPILTGMGLDPLPVTSGSKGIHLYAALEGRDLSCDDVAAVARELARHLSTEYPDLVVADMRRSLRAGKVFIDWSQNNGAKTTIAPYSPRGRERPWVAAPRTWEELDDPAVRQLEMSEVARRFESDGDLLAPLLRGHYSALEPTPERMAAWSRLAEYRGKRDRSRTPEPFGGEGGSEGAGRSGSSSGTRPSFVIQEHHASRLHWDFRLEHDGVLVSWALPRGEPTDPARNHLAVQTEDHPLEYGSFAGTIPRGEYGAGEVSIWDAGWYELVKWHDDEVIAVLHGERYGTRQLALIRTGGAGGAKDRNQWLIHRMKRQPEGTGGTDAPRGGGTGASGAAGRGSGTGSPESSESAAAGSGLSGAATGSASSGASAGVSVSTTAVGAAAGPAASLRPMLATAAGPRELRGLDQDAWAFEMKWDGFRVLAHVARADAEGEPPVRLVSRSGLDMTTTFPELRVLADAVSPGAPPLVLDGEIVALDADGRPSFRRLQQRANLYKERDVDRARRRVGVEVFLFDVLRVGGRDLTGESYTVRRAELERVVTPGERVHVPPVMDADGGTALAASRELGLEGVVAKRRSAGYSVGRRSREWLKVKHVLSQEVVVIGWRPLHADAGREDPTAVGGLLLAVPAPVVAAHTARNGSDAGTGGASSTRPADAGSGGANSGDVGSDGTNSGGANSVRSGDTGSGWTTTAASAGAGGAATPGAALRFAGRVGTGFAERERQEIARRLTAIRVDDAAAPDVPALDARRARWCEPVLVGEVDHAGWTRDGRLRHPVWRGWRPDRSPDDLVD